MLFNCQQHNYFTSMVQLIIYKVWEKFAAGRFINQIGLIWGKGNTDQMYLPPVAFGTPYKKAGAGAHHHPWLGIF